MAEISMQSDQFGYVLTGAETAQAATYNGAVQDYLHYSNAVFPALKELCAANSEFVMAHLLKGYLLLSMGTRDTVGAALKSLEQVSVSLDSATERERNHAVALAAWARGDTTNAVARWDQILRHHPLDIIALKLQHFALFWLGHPEHMRDVCARVMPAWKDMGNRRGYLLGMQAFALEECGEYAAAESLGREAVSLDPEDLWSVHAVAHVLEMQCRLDDGLQWLDYPYDQWQDRNPFRGHLWWHKAMFAIEKGDYDLTLEIYDAGVHSDESAFYLDVQNTVSMLARLEFAGVDVGDRWHSLVAVAEQAMTDHVLLFTVPHQTMALARAQRFDLVEKQLDSLQDFATDHQTTASRWVQPLLLPVCEAIRDFYLGEYQKAADRLKPLRYQLQPLGGSHAQRDIFAIYLLDAVTKAGDIAWQKSLLIERLARHPQSVVTNQRYQQACC